jgi:nitrous oxide reductase accessory protein NosL
MKALPLALLAGWMAACNTAPADGPAEIKFDRDTCHKCGMVISDRQYAAEVRGGPRRSVEKFDDVGCALSWLDAQPFAVAPSTETWVAAMNTGAWLDARTARFVEGRTTPMGYGFGAVANDGSGVNFEELRLRVKHAGGHHRLGAP